MSELKPRLFWLISRAAHVTYARLPIFGALRGAVAIIRRDHGYVMVERSDGYGLAFPGGMSPPWEKPETTVRREVTEETGLQVAGVDFKFDFHSSQPFATHTYVFEVDATGELKRSWEGVPQVVRLSEMKGRLMISQQPMLEYLLSQSQCGS
jgi:8-oxo-dGTP pyrophosphatase MutT (NUDIX family)